MDEATDTPGWGSEFKQAFDRAVSAAEGTPLDDRSVRRLLTASLLQPPGLGEQVGPFELVESIGSGGFGEVFRAVQREPFEREVAVKVLVGIERGASALSRFERERQVLVRLRHPGIVRLLEAGITACGLPWFAMDLVTGRTIDRWADESAPDLPTRLRVLRDLADAVAAAHRQGVLHRDLKPANVLIQEAESGPRVQVVDFGIAKVLDEGPSGEATTRAGHVIGTPEYMSPEAASLEADRLDTRSDVYSLGLVAFRVLAGRAALESPPGTSFARRLQAAASPEIPRLSTACRQPAWPRRLRGEIEWVVGRAISVDPADRYPSAGELKEEFDRLLAGEPVAAAPPSAAYQLRAFTRRHKAIVAAGAFSFLALAAATAVSVSFAISEAQQRSRAEIALEGEARERTRAEAALEAEAKRREELARVAAFQEANLTTIDVGRLGVDLRASMLAQVPEGDSAKRDALDQALVGIDFTDLGRQMLGLALLSEMPGTIRDEFAEQPVVAGRLLQATAETCVALGLSEQALVAAREAGAIFSSQFGREHEGTIAAATTEFAALQQLRRADEMAAEMEEWWSIAQRVLPPGHPVRNECGSRYASTLADTIEGYEQQLTIYEALDREADEAGLVRDLRVADARAGSLEALGRFEDALAVRQAIVEKIETGDLSGSNEALRGGSARFSLRLGHVNNLSDLGRLQEAIERCERLVAEATAELGGDHPVTITIKADYATLLGLAGMLEQAAEIEKDVLATRLLLMGERHPETIRAMQNLALRNRRLGNLAASEVLYRDAMRLSAEVLPLNDPQRMTIEVNFGVLLQSTRRSDEALAVLEGVYPRIVATQGETHPMAVSARRNIGAVLNDLGRFEEALPIFEEGFEATERNNGPDAPTTIIALANLGAVYQSVGRLDESLATLDEVLVRARRTLPPTHWNLGVFLIYRGRTLITMERFADAVATIDEARALLETALGPEHPRSIESRRGLMQAYEAWQAKDPSGGHDAAVARWKATLPSEG
jgi:eukaryotic-like serine/threonine-protein kinase